METTVTSPKLASQADNLKEYKALKEQARKATPVEVPSTPEGKTGEPETPSLSAPQGETAGESGTPSVVQEQQHQEAKKPKRDADSAFAEMRRQIAERDTELSRLKAELEKRNTTPAPSPVTAPAISTPQPQPQQQTAEGKPRLQEFVGKLQTGETYEDAVERYNEALVDWKYQERTKQDAQRSEQQKVNDRLTAARQAHPDFDTAMGAVHANTPVVAQFLRDFDNSLEVFYSIGTDPGAAQQLAAMTPSQQFAELVYRARSLRSTASPEQPLKPVPPVSRVAPPPTPINGSSAAPTQKLKDAADYAGWKAIKASRR